MEFIFTKYKRRHLNTPHSLVIYFWNSITAAAVVYISAVAVTVSTAFVDVISLIIIVTRSVRLSQA